MSEPEVFTDEAGRKFHYFQGRRIYDDGGKDIATPVPYPPTYYPEDLPPVTTAHFSASPSILREARTLRMVLQKRLGVRVPLRALLACKNLRQTENAVMMLLPDPGKSYEARRALGRKIADLAVFCYGWTRHDVICEFVCLKCHRRLGPASLRLAKESYYRQLARAHASHPNALITVYPDSDAVCPHCGKSYAYTPRSKARLTAVD